MKRQVGRVLLGWALVIAMTFAACAPKDADIEKGITGAIASYPGVSVSVKDGVATITGEVADDATKAAVETAAKAVKGVKSVANNLTIPPPPPPPAPVVINPDETLQQSVAAIISGQKQDKVTATVKDGVVTLTGEIKKADLPALIQQLNEIKPKKIENKLVIKK
ncbi:BON domain-containing protein [Flavihumibacter fluvii]|uniref:BON domain-containing protein n=1 Tax=Flavihumibacter fluvii TaxID=2838157 RepID=UPI001BDE2A5F|nr:BON domain-containing protein [Flavihumibacter fluvii]ULQ52326.1 BON domain-containing protein [Flavihumibacter fluvii]